MAAPKMVWDSVMLDLERIESMNIAVLIEELIDIQNKAISFSQNANTKDENYFSIDYDNRCLNLYYKREETADEKRARERTVDLEKKKRVYLQRCATQFDLEHSKNTA